MRTSDDNTFKWLNNIPEDLPSADLQPTPQDLPSKKRRRRSSTTLLSPPNSQGSPTQTSHAPRQTGLLSLVKMSPSTPLNKRQKTGEHYAPAQRSDDDDNEETPTQAGKGPSSRLRDSDTSSLSHKSSQASNKSSHSKMLSLLSLHQKGATTKSLDVDDPDVPNSLVDLSDEMERIALAVRVVPGYLKSEISRRKTSNRKLKLFENSVFNAEGIAITSEPIGFPTTEHHGIVLDEILQLVDDAMDCKDMGQDEAGWNCLIHAPLLRTVIYGGTSRRHQLDGFSPCTSASILPGYKVDTSHGKRVDFVFHLDPSKDVDQPRALEATQNLRQVLTDTSINHTSYQPLRSRPISISIETKKAGDDEEKAELQMATWQAAQWKHLEKLAGDNLDKLPFIPGILIQGHKWIFVASTFSNGKTTLFTGREFGSTETPLKAFQVIAGIRRLREWSLDIFWSWYKAYVLEIPPKMT